MGMRVLDRSQQRIAGGRHSLVLLVVISAGLVNGIPPRAETEQVDDVKSIRKTCGRCPDGYATTAVVNAPEVCRDGDPTLVQCVPLGASLLAVCGSCPDTYSEIGHSNVPSRCGAKDGGLLSQCQSQQPNSSNLPDPTQGGILCPPNCGATGVPGQGAMPPPPKFRPGPEKK